MSLSRRSQPNAYTSSARSRPGHSPILEIKRLVRDLSLLSEVGFLSSAAHTLEEERGTYLEEES
jgi:hypothetical protein